MEQATAEFDVDPVRRVVERVGAQVLQDDFEDADRGEADDQDDEGRKRLVNEDLVDNELEEERREQAERLDGKRGDENVSERASISLERRNEPGEAESRGVLAGAAETSGDEDRAASRSGGNGGDRRLGWFAGREVEDAEFSVRRPGGDWRELSVAEFDDGWQRQGGEPFRRDILDYPRAQTQRLGRGDDGFGAGAGQRDGEIARDLRRVGGDPVIGRNERKGLEG